MRVLLVSSTQRSSAKAGGPVAVCKAQTIVPAVSGKPKILTMFSSGGCSVDQADPGGQVISGRPGACEAPHSSLKFLTIPVEAYPEDGPESRGASQIDPKLPFARSATLVAHG